jgi:hypothetical protein
MEEDHRQSPTETAGGKDQPGESVPVKILRDGEEKR